MGSKLDRGAGGPPRKRKHYIMGYVENVLQDQFIISETENLPFKATQCSALYQNDSLNTERMDGTQLLLTINAIFPSS